MAPSGRGDAPGSGSVIEVVGEPGAGKSRLIEEFRTVADGITTLTVTGEYYDSSTPYGALRATIRGLLGLRETGEPPTPETVRQAIDRIAPRTWRLGTAGGRRRRRRPARHP